MDWFSVDKQGLAKLLERRGKAGVLTELVQNAWDENTTQVGITIDRIVDSPFVRVTVTDDSPQGFADLTHAFTLFAESTKKSDVSKRGRFNLGEKLVLALCRRAEIQSTTGTVVFDDAGRHRSRAHTERGSVFVGEIRMTAAEVTECRDRLQLLIVPDGIVMQCVIDGQATGLWTRAEPYAQFTEALQTELADAEGVLRRSVRNTLVTLYAANGQAWLYELGIPVVEIDGPYHVNVHQKVPLNFDRDNVTPAYLAKIHAVTLEHTASTLTADDVNQSWARLATQECGDDLSDDTVRRIADLRFSEHRVAFDPSDLEANNLAVSKGYQVVYGRSMSSTEWDLMRRVGAVLPAGQVTPSRPEGTEPRIDVPKSEWTDGMRRVARLVETVAPTVLGVAVQVTVSNDPGVTVEASYTHGARVLDFNVGRLGHGWFTQPLDRVLSLVIHELAHERSGNHLSHEYYDALCDIGAALTALAVQSPEVFLESDYAAV